MTKDGLKKPNYWGSLTQVRRATNPQSKSHGAWDAMVLWLQLSLGASQTHLSPSHWVCKNLETPHAQAATLRVGNYRGEEAYAPFSSLLPMVHPNDIVWGGWDISGLNLADAMERAQVFLFPAEGTPPC
jgi:hypothetical protein